MEAKLITVRSYKAVLLITWALLLVVSFLYYELDNFSMYRLLRGFVSLVFLGIVIFYTKKKTNLVLASFLFIFGISSISTVWYENASIAVVSLFLNLFACILLIIALWPKASFKNLGIVLTVVFILMVIINAYIFYEFISKLRDFANGSLNYVVMLLVSIAVVIIGFLSLLYNHSCNTKTSLVFTMAIFLFIFAGVFRAISYYGFGYGDVSIYVARFTFITANAMLAHFMLMPKTEKENVSLSFSKYSEEQKPTSLGV